MSELSEQTRLLRQVRLALQENDFATAINSLNEVIQMAEAKEDWGAVARHLGNLALAYYRSDNAIKAIDSFGRGIQLARQEKDRLTENGLLGNMGNVLREMGHFEEAIRYLNQALIIAQELGDVRGRGIWLSNLGLVYDDLKQPMNAHDLHQQSVEVARQLQDQPNLASRLGNLGNTLIAHGDIEDALVYFKEAAHIYQQLGRKQDAALRLGIMGNIYASLGRSASPAPIAIQYFADALENYQACSAIARELKDYPSEAELLKSMGSVLVEIGRYSDAVDYFNAALYYFTQMNQLQKVKQVQDSLITLNQYIKSAK